MGDSVSELPPLPRGFTLDQPPPPEGFTLDEPVAPANLGIADVGLQHPAAKFAEGSLLGLQNAATGLQQLIAAGSELAGGPIAEDLTAEISARDARMEELGLVGQAGGLVGEVAPSMALPGGPAGGLARRVAGGAALDAAASVADPVREDQTRAGIMTTAGAFGTGGRLLKEGVSPLFRKIANARAGEFKSEDIKELIRTADAEDISIFFDDISDSPMANRLSIASEYFGRLGTAPGRQAQNIQAQQAAERWLADFAGDSDDYAGIIQGGLKRRLNFFQRAAARKYSRVVELIGDDPVELTGFDAALDAAIEKEIAKGGRANAQVVNLFERYRDSARGSFEDMIEFRSDFNKDISNLYRGENVPNKTAGDLVRDVREALNDDLGQVARDAAAFNEWRAADEFYANTVVKFKKGKLAALAKEDSAANFDQQSAWKYLTQQSGNNETRARLMWQSLDPKGRAAVRNGMLAEALEASTREGAAFSPARYASFIEKRMDVADQFFRGKSNDEIKGFVKVLRHIERAGQVAENPPTGQRLVPLILAGGVTFEPVATSGAAGAAFSIKQLFQSQGGRNLLLAANTASEGSQRMDDIAEQIVRAMARSSNQGEE